MSSEPPKMSTAEFDQAVAEARDQLPKLWRALYTGSLEEGFTEAQAMTLVLGFMRRTAED